MIALWTPLIALLVTDCVSSFHLDLNDSVKYENVTDENHVSDYLEEDYSWENDPFVIEANNHCEEGDALACLKSSAAGSFGSLFSKTSYSVVREARFIRTKPYTKELIFPEVSRLIRVNASNLGRQSSTSGNNVWGSAVDFLIRRVEAFVKTTVFEVELTEDLTGGGEYAPRFLDEIYTEIDAIEDKNDKPHKRYEFKKLFIPLLFMLKLFKVKLLVLLPIIFGLVSFKKVLAFLAIIIPGIIGYYKVCKPDLGQSYGSFGHSSYYHGPPSIRQKILSQHENRNDWESQDMSRINGAAAQDNSPYRGYKPLATAL